jgi:hypothetical protein
MTNNNVMMPGHFVLYNTCMQVEISYKNIREVRVAPRAFGLWGDCVIFLKVRVQQAVWLCLVLPSRSGDTYIWLQSCLWATAPVGDSQGHLMSLVVDW